jgi:hypothetical protein
LSGLVCRLAAAGAGELRAGLAPDGIAQETLARRRVERFRLAPYCSSVVHKTIDRRAVLRGNNFPKFNIAHVAPAAPPPRFNTIC